jgi:hypothetical protein
VAKIVRGEHRGRPAFERKLKKSPGTDGAPSCENPTLARRTTHKGLKPRLQLLVSRGPSSMPKFVIWAVLAAFGFVAAITALNIYTPKTMVVCNATSC